MNWLLPIFRTKEKEDSKETVTTATRKDTTARITALPRRIKATRPILREAETRNTAITAIVMGILRLSASESLGILVIRNSNPREETKQVT